MGDLAASHAAGQEMFALSTSRGLQVGGLHRHPIYLHALHVIFIT